MKERLKVGNRISCLIEKVELNYILASFKTAGIAYRGVLINENCSAVRRQIPDNYYPQKAFLDDEITENLRNEIKNRELDTTSKVLRSKKARQSCLILDNYDFTSYHNDGTTNEIALSNEIGKSPIDSIRGLVESIDNSKELSIPPVIQNVSKSYISPESKDEEIDTKPKPVNNKSEEKPKLVLDLAVQDDQYVIRKPAGFSFMGARSRLLKSPVKTLNRNSALSKVDATDQPIVEDISVLSEKNEQIEEESKEETVVIKRKRFKTVKEKELAAIREKRVKRKKKEKSTEENVVVQKLETPPLKIKITINKNKGRIDQPLEKVVVDDILSKTKENTPVFEEKENNTCEPDTDNVIIEKDKRRTVEDSSKTRNKRGKDSDVEAPRSKSSSPHKVESVSANSSPAPKPRAKRIDPIIIALKNIKKHDQLRRNKNLRTAGSSLPIIKDVTQLRNRRLGKILKGKRKGDQVSTIRVSKRIGLKRLNKEKEQSEKVDKKTDTDNIAEPTTDVCAEEAKVETVVSNDEVVQPKEITKPKQFSQPKAVGKRGGKKKLNLMNKDIIPTQSISEEVKLRRKLLSAKKEKKVLNEPEKSVDITEVKLRRKLISAKKEEKVLNEPEKSVDITEVKLRRKLISAKKEEKVLNEPEKSVDITEVKLRRKLISAKKEEKVLNEPEKSVDITKGRERGIKGRLQKPDKLEVIKNAKNKEFNVEPKAGLEESQKHDHGVKIIDEDLNENNDDLSVRHGVKRNAKKSLLNVNKYKAAQRKNVETTTTIVVSNKALKQVAKNRLKKASERSLRTKQLNIVRLNKDISTEVTNLTEFCDVKSDNLQSNATFETIQKVAIESVAPITRGKRKTRESLPLPLLLPDPLPSTIETKLSTSTPCSKKEAKRNDMDCDDYSLIQNDELKAESVKKIVKRKKKRRRFNPVRKTHLKYIDKNVVPEATENTDTVGRSESVESVEEDLRSNETIVEENSGIETIEDETEVDNDKTHSYCIDKEDDETIEASCIVLSDDDSDDKKNDLEKNEINDKKEDKIQDAVGEMYRIKKVAIDGLKGTVDENQDCTESSLDDNLGTISSTNAIVLALHEETDSDKQILSEQCVSDLVNFVVSNATNNDRKEKIHSFGPKISTDPKKDLMYLISNTTKQATSHREVKAPTNVATTGNMIYQMSSIVGKTDPIFGANDISFPRMSSMKRSPHSEYNEAIETYSKSNSSSSITGSDLNKLNDTKILNYSLNNAKNKLVLIPKTIPHQELKGKGTENVIDKAYQVRSKIDHSNLLPLMTILDSSSTTEGEVEAINDENSVILDKVELKDIRKDIRILSRNLRVKTCLLNASLSPEKEVIKEENSLSENISVSCCNSQPSHQISTSLNNGITKPSEIDLACHENCLLNEEKKNEAISKPRKNRRKPTQVFKSLTKSIEEVKNNMLPDSDKDLPVVSRNMYLLGNKRTSFDIKLCDTEIKEPKKEQIVPKIKNIFSAERQYLKKPSRPIDKIECDVDPFVFSGKDSEEEEEIEEIDDDYEDIEEESDDGKKEVGKNSKYLAKRKKTILQKKHKTLTNKKQKTCIKIKREQLIEKEKDRSKRKFSDSNVEEMEEKPISRMSKRQRSIEQNKMNLKKEDADDESSKEYVSTKHSWGGKHISQLQSDRENNVSSDEKENLSKRLSQTSTVRNGKQNTKCNIVIDDGSETSEYDQEESDVESSDMQISETEKLNNKNVLYRDKKRKTKEVGVEHLDQNLAKTKLSQNQNVLTSDKPLTEDIVSLDKSHNTRFRGKKSVIPTLNLSPRRYNKTNSDILPSKLASKSYSKENTDNSLAIEDEDEKKPLHFCQEIDEKSDDEVKSTNETKDSIDLNNTSATNNITKKHKKRKKKHRSFNIISYNSLLKPINRVSNEIKTGDIVWGRCLGFGWWPGQVTSLLKSKREAYVSWHYSSTSSIMLTTELDLFLPHFKKRFAMNKTGGYVKAVIEAQKAWEEKYGVL